MTRERKLLSVTNDSILLGLERLFVTSLEIYRDRQFGTTGSLLEGLPKFRLLNLYQEPKWRRRVILGMKIGKGILLW
jgi:hypothetical protein